jgi:nitrate reductase cytochrome c-type subunit
MPSSRKLCQIALLSAFAAAAPAVAQDADAAKKKTTQQQKKAEKPKSNMEKDTTSNYPPTQVPGSGY